MKYILRKVRVGACLLMIAVLALPGRVSAGLIQAIDCRTDGCGLEHVPAILYWAANWMLGITGLLALAFFIYGGFVFLTSGGSSERVTKGRTIITQAIIGIIIVFAANLIIQMVFDALGVKGAAGGIWKSIGWFGSGDYKSTP